MAAPGKKGAGDASAERLQKRELALRERETHYVAAECQVFQAVDARVIGAERVKSFVKSARVGGNGWGRDGLLNRSGLWRGILRCISAVCDADKISAEQQQNDQGDSHGPRHVIHSATMIAASISRIIPLFSVILGFVHCVCNV